ncbi:MAG: DNA integrity scanning diadenylate cyclase DisA [Acidimicrobiia bacterium]
MTPHSSASLALLRRFAPGTPLRNAAELIMAQGTGGLVVIGSGPQVESVRTGGFQLDGARFTAQRVAELAKMDGGIVVDERDNEITHANVHFMPDQAIETDETGTRFRTAERVARQTGAVVLAVSEEGHLRAVVFSGTTRFSLQSVTDLLGEANQRLQSLERIRRQFDESVTRLDRYEADGLVSMWDVVAVIQRAAVIRAIGSDLDLIAAETGDEAPLITLQAEALGEDVEEIADLVNSDYQARKPRKGSTVFRKLDALDEDDLYRAEAIGDALGFVNLDQAAAPRGIRALADVPRLPDSVRDSILRRFSTYDKLVSASSDQLAELDGIGKARAKTIRSYLKRRQGAGSAETSL